MINIKDTIIAIEKKIKVVEIALKSLARGETPSGMYVYSL